MTVKPIAYTYEAGRPVYTEVAVTSRYSVTGLVFTRLFGQGSVYEGRPVTRSAAVCLPGTSGPTGGFCARPNGRGEG